MAGFLYYSPMFPISQEMESFITCRKKTVSLCTSDFTVGWVCGFCILSCVGPFDYMFFDQLQIMMNLSLTVED